MNVVELRGERYLSKRVYCGKNYIVKTGKPVLIDECHSYSCVHCRRGMKKKLMNRVVFLAGMYMLNRHMVITLPGEEYRDVVDPDESFRDFSEKFKSFKKYYKRKFKKNLVYVAFPRSQMNGYCHYHVLIGEYVPKRWMQETCRKLSLGFADIKYADVQRVRNYLSKYWYKEHEWFIPKDKKHFTCSRNMVMFNRRVKEEGWYLVSVPPNVVDQKLFFDRYCSIVLGVRPPEYFWLWSCFVGFESEFLRKNCIGYSGQNGTCDIRYKLGYPCGAALPHGAYWRPWPQKAAIVAEGISECLGKYCVSIDAVVS